MWKFENTKPSDIDWQLEEDLDILSVVEPKEKEINFNIVEKSEIDYHLLCRGHYIPDEL